SGELLHGFPERAASLDQVSAQHPELDEIITGALNFGIEELIRPGDGSGFAALSLFEHGAIEDHSPYDRTRKGENQAADARPPCRDRAGEPGSDEHDNDLEADQPGPAGMSEPPSCQWIALVEGSVLLTEQAPGQHQVQGAEQEEC